LYYNDFDLSGDPNYLAGAQINSVTFSFDANSVATNIMALSGSVVPIPEPSTLFLSARRVWGNHFTPGEAAALRPEVADGWVPTAGGPFGQNFVRGSQP
jgi:hypothetical protein